MNQANKIVKNNQNQHKVLKQKSPKLCPHKNQTRENHEC